MAGRGGFRGGRGGYGGERYGGQVKCLAQMVERPFPVACGTQCGLSPRDVFGHCGSALCRPIIWFYSWVFPMCGGKSILRIRDANVHWRRAAMAEATAPETGAMAGPTAAAMVARMAAARGDTVGGMATRAAAGVAAMVEHQGAGAAAMAEARLAATAATIRYSPISGPLHGRYVTVYSIKMR
jgi:hypothetical protein